MGLGLNIGANASATLGRLSIVGESATVAMATPAWCLLDLGELWVPQAMRNSDDIEPGAAGQFPYRLDLDEANHSLDFAISGKVNLSGTPYSSFAVGLETNIAYLDAQFVQPATEAGTRSATLTLPSGNTRSADIKVKPIRRGAVTGWVMRASLPIVIPAGRFS